MKKRIVCMILLCAVIINIFCMSVPAFAATEPPQIISEGAILIDANSGRVLYEKNADTRLYPASTTKIMTAVLLLENLQLDSVIAASYDAVMSIPAGGSNIGISSGEQLTAEQLLYAILVASANEACNVVAEYMCGDVDSFVVKMNEKAQQLGMSNTKFLNPHGLHSPEHYTTARDMSILARYAMQYDKFREVVSTARYTIDPTNKYNETRYLNNTNYLVSKYQNASYFYAPATGIKTGYTSQAGNCLVSSASKAGTDFIAVTLNAKPQSDAIYSFIDSKALFEYGFANYRTRTIAKPGEIIAEAKVGEASGTDVVTLEAKVELDGLLPADADINNVQKTITLQENILAPIAVGDVLGSATYTYEGNTLGTVELVSNVEVNRDLFIFVMNRIFGFFDLPWVKIPLLIIIALVVLMIVSRKLKRRKRRRYLRSKRY